MSKTVYIPKDKYENTEYIRNRFINLGYTVTSSWDDATIVFNPFTKKIPSDLVGKDIYSFPNHGMITIKTNLPAAVRQITNDKIIPETFTITNLANINDTIKLLNEKDIYIIKPGHLFGGLKIAVLRKSAIMKYILSNSTANHNTWVIQEYLDPPLLIKHKTKNFMCKFDLRVNLFVCTNRITKEPEIYKYNKTLVRVSDEKYSTDDIGNLLAHVTNLDLRKVITDNAKRVLEDTPELISYIPAINDFLKEYIYPLIMLTYTGINEEKNNYFQRYGVDLLIMQNGNIKLLEVNNNPGQSLHNELVNSAINYSVGLPIPQSFELIKNTHNKKDPAMPKTFYIANNIFDEKDYYIKMLTTNGYTQLQEWDNADVIFAKSFHKSNNNNEELRNKLIYMYPNSEIICNKIHLANTIDKYCSDKSIAPRTWFGTASKKPQNNYLHISQLVENLTKEYPQDQLFIVKPSNESCGISINVMKLRDVAKYVSLPENNTYDIGNNRKKFIPDWIIQEYIQSPLLIKHSLTGKMVKFDIRYNVFMTTNKQGKIEYHIINDFAVRISDDEYTLAKLDHLIHVTNISTREQTEHNFKFASAIPELQKNNRINKVHNFVKESIIPLIKLVYTPPNNGVNYFARFGIDLMITNDDRVMLIEINRNPGEPITLDCANATLEYVVRGEINSNKFTKIDDDIVIYYDDANSIIEECYSIHSLINSGETRAYSDIVYTVNDDIKFNTKNKNYKLEETNSSGGHLAYFYYNKKLNIGKLLRNNLSKENYKKIKKKIISGDLESYVNEIPPGYYALIQFNYDNNKLYNVSNGYSQELFAKIIKKRIL